MKRKYKTGTKDKMRREKRVGRGYRDGHRFEEGREGQQSNRHMRGEDENINNIQENSSVCKFTGEDVI